MRKIVQTVYYRGINITVNAEYLYNICIMADVVQMLYKCFVFAGMSSCWPYWALV